MNKGFVFGLLAVLALAGCQMKELDVRPQESKHFTATIEDSFNGGETKTYIDEQGNVRWKRGDQVSIFAGDTVNEQYQVTDASDGKTSAAFNKVSGGGFVGGGEIDNNVAFYPYASTAEIAKSGSAYVISDITLPATQTYAENSFGNGAFPMAAVTTSTTDMHLKFKNVLGGLKLQLKGTASIASISITGNQNEILCGSAEVTVSNGSAPSINLTDATAKTVTLDCGESVQLNAEAATPFVIALPPMTMEGGFTVVVTDTDGKQLEIVTTKTQTINRSSLLKMPAVTFDRDVDYSEEPLTITSIGSSSVALSKVGSPDAITLEYKKNAGEWSSYTIDSAIDLDNGETLMFRAGESGNDCFSKNSSNYYTFLVTGAGSVEASGNIMSLLDKSLETLTFSNSGTFSYLFNNCVQLVNAANLVLPVTTLKGSSYAHMFSGCTGLVSAPNLPATSLGSRCYEYMFSGCTGLTSAPELPAVSLTYYCYEKMFSGCTGLISAPDLPATSLESYCYRNMFEDCTGLTSAPELPAKTLKSECYSGMFKGCTGLTSAPDLPATSLGSYCYYGMFEDCTGLTSAPELPAKTLRSDCYNGMFHGCTGLTSAPDLPATSLESNCYYGMFSGCTGLTSAPDLPATEMKRSCYANMFWGCSGLTSAPDLPATTLAPYCYASMFMDCTGLTSAPDLPAPTLEEGCYRFMFINCANLTKAPDLPALTLVKECYVQMFHGCSKLNYVKALFLGPLSDWYDNMDYIGAWLSNVSETGTFVRNSAATWDLYYGEIPSDWSVLTE